MCVVYFVFWYVKHRLKIKFIKKKFLPYFFFLCYANQTIFFLGLITFNHKSKTGSFSHKTGNFQILAKSLAGTQQLAQRIR